MTKDQESRCDKSPGAGAKDGVEIGTGANLEAAR